MDNYYSEDTPDTETNFEESGDLETEDNVQSDDDNTVVENDEQEESDNEVDDDDNSNVFDEDLKDTEAINTETEYENRIVKNEDRISIPILTKYEKPRILGDRAKQLSEGAKPLIRSDKKMSAMEIAIEELRQRRIPLKIKRVRPDGMIEIWSVNELEYTI